MALVFPLQYPYNVTTTEHEIDLYWLHAWDFMTPVEEVMRALDDLVRAGKILYVGISDTPAWVIA